MYISSSPFQFSDYLSLCLAAAAAVAVAVAVAAAAATAWRQKKEIFGASGD